MAADEKKSILLHLEELRRRILFSIIAIVLLSVLSYAFAEEVLGFLARYVKNLVFISPEEAFLAHLKIAFFCGLVLSAPIILFNVLKFIWVALEKKEKRIFGAYLVLGIFLFLGGAAFSYFVALPAAMKFLLGFSSDLVRPYISISRYVSFSGFLILSFALAFETPLFIVLLTKSGIVNSSILRKKRRYFIVILFVVAAMLTPI